MDEIFKFETIKGDVTKFKKIDVEVPYFQIYSEMSQKWRRTSHLYALDMWRNCYVFERFVMVEKCDSRIKMIDGKEFFTIE